MWIILLEVAGVVLSLGGWFGFHSFWLLLAGIILMGLFDCVMYSSGGQLKGFRLAIAAVIIGAVVGGVTQKGILTAAMLGFAVYSAFFAVLKLILLLIGMLDKE